MKKLLLIIICVCGCVQVYAQDLPMRSELQPNTDLAFFDPGHTDKKKEEYHFSMQYRLEAGYVQNHHRSENKSYENLFMHGFRAGMTFDFMLPLRFSIQTGLLYTFTTGKALQNWGVMSYEDYTSPDPVTGKVYPQIVYHQLQEHQLTIPIRMYYNVHLWKDLNLFFFTGPQVQVGVVLQDNTDPQITTATKQWMRQTGQPYESRDRYKEKEQYRACVQWGLGGGLEWANYRLQAGYDFGLNNLVRNKAFSGQKMWEWHWFVSFCYQLPVK